MCAVVLDVSSCECAARLLIVRLDELALPLHPVRAATLAWYAPRQ